MWKTIFQIQCLHTCNIHFSTYNSFTFTKLGNKAWFTCHARRPQWFGGRRHWFYDSHGRRGTCKYSGVAGGVVMAREHGRCWPGTWRHPSSFLHGAGLPPLLPWHLGDISVHCLLSPTIFTFLQLFVERRGIWGFDPLINFSAFLCWTIAGPKSKIAILSQDFSC